MVPRIVITPGEPAGIGPDVTLLAAQHSYTAELICIADPELLMERAQHLRLNINLDALDWDKPPVIHAPGHLKCLPVNLANKAQAGLLNTANADYVLESLQLATSLCLEKKVDALVTGPVKKSIFKNFTGHTEFLAKQSNVDHSIMLFVIDELKVALMTTHVPLKNVSQLITPELITKTLNLLHAELRSKFSVDNPTLLVCGLNPHAGEEGMLGAEEQNIIIPALNKLRGEGMNILGPLPADTAFTSKHMQSADVIIGMYHDQVLPVVKYMGFDRAINVTLGLPFIRTSVDHGTALDIAGTGHANPGSMIAAINLAASMLAKRDHPQL